VTQCQQEITQAETDQANLSREIEEKKNSDIYTFAQLIKARARGELGVAREGLAAFPQKFPGSPLLDQARTQLAAVNEQLATAEAKLKQQQADEVRTEAEARVELLAKAAKGQATLSEMRQALVGKSRAQVSDLLGQPSDTASDQWNYHKQMIVNPLTGEQTGLTVYFLEGAVQSVDYNRSGP
jgi:capsule polysaccharide export protein KpsE/RkpR